MTARALVTGATGMLGGYIARKLVEDGWSVRALVRSAPQDKALQALGVELTEGRLEDARSLEAAARGCAAVFHAAAEIGSGTAGERFHEINVTGTANVVRAAELTGARLVLVSSTAVYGRARYGALPTDATGSLPALPDHDVYGRSKQDAEAVVLAACRAGHVWSSVVRPPVMYGVGDRQFAPRVGPVLRKGVFPLIGGGRTTLTLVHARNVAEGAVLAATRDDARGHVFLLADDFPITVAEFVRGASEGLDRRIAAPAIPRSVGRVGFAALAAGLCVAGRGDLARHARGTFEMLTRDNPFTSRKAREVLGWRPSVPPGVGLPEAFRWWRSSLPQHGTEG
ncbi:MAG: NAD-dependent epimerase/dehydratase family protein [Longimicrobiales bacterium]|nr:NAD-dependent epimerase/dehydratase family protein [Longimicrobiales bacterium]